MKETQVYLTDEEITEIRQQLEANPQVEQQRPYRSMPVMQIPASYPAQYSLSRLPQVMDPEFEKLYGAYQEWKSYLNEQAVLLGIQLADTRMILKRTIAILRKRITAAHPGRKSEGGLSEAAKEEIIEDQPNVVELRRLEHFQVAQLQDIKRAADTCETYVTAMSRILSRFQAAQPSSGGRR